MPRAFGLLPVSQRLLTGLCDSSLLVLLPSTSTAVDSCHLRQVRCHQKCAFSSANNNGRNGGAQDHGDEAADCALTASRARLNVRFDHGLPSLNVPLPSRREYCQFTLRPVSDTVGSFCESLKREDHGIEIVALYTEGGVRIASCTDIQHLLHHEDFRLRINDLYYDVVLPADRRPHCDRLETGEHMPLVDDLKAKIASLHTIFNIDEFKVERERLLLSQLEKVEIELKPMEVIRRRIDAECVRHARRVLWGGFLVMGLQTGIFARLTFYEYSWDIMEPVTYFATFSTVIATFAYYLLTNQDFEYTIAHRRLFTQQFHRRARVHNFNVSRYNELATLAAELRRDLERLRDPLLQHLPASRLRALESERARLWIFDAENRRKRADVDENGGASTPKQRL